MKHFIKITYKSIRLLYWKYQKGIHQLITTFMFYAIQVEHKSFTTTGIPYISLLSKNSKIVLGEKFKMHNILKGNPIGRTQPCVFFVGKNASIVIGDNVGISSTAIVAYQSIQIDDNVKIGGGVCIYDTDFHSIDAKKRANNVTDGLHTKCAPVHIKNNVFIGAHSTILKGVCIGENSIIGACSVVTKNIPANEIWAGNPAKFIRSIDYID